MQRKDQAMFFSGPAAETMLHIFPDSDPVITAEPHRDTDGPHSLTDRVVILHENYRSEESIKTIADGINRRDRSILDRIPEWDRREPLPTAFAVRYANETTATARFPRHSALMLWKTSTELPGPDEVGDCGSYMYYAWDEDEHVVTHGLSCPFMCPTVLDPNLFPFRTQLVPLDADNFDLPANAGWMLVIFPPSYGSSSSPQSRMGLLTSLFNSRARCPRWKVPLMTTRPSTRFCARAAPARRASSTSMTRPGMASMETFSSLPRSSKIRPYISPAAL